MKKMAGITTAVTGVGTVAGGVALGTGLAKVGVDKEIEELESQIARLIAERGDVPIIGGRHSNKHCRCGYVGHKSGQGRFETTN